MESPYIPAGFIVYVLADLDWWVWTYWSEMQSYRQPVDWGTETRVMGIVNVTPDSFHDGGRFASVDAAIEHGVRLVAEGAQALDVGGESTRPGAPDVSVQEELARVLPVVQGLKELVDVPVSVDTWKSEVAQAVIEAGADWINDVCGGVRDPKMLNVVAEAGVPYVAMHMRGTPQTMQTLTEYDDILAEIKAYFVERLDAFEKAGGRQEMMIFDPGIGFAKKPLDNYYILANLSEFRALGQPVLVGPSRKSFLMEAGVQRTEDRLPGTLAALTVCAQSGVEVVRVHDVKEAVQVVSVAQMIEQSR
jgi:dihydropteroate synthase